MKKLRNYKTNMIKELYAYSGNQCAFPGCNQKLIDKNGNYGEICHIYGLNLGSARYDPQKSEEELNSISNLILLCPNHHKMVDSDVENFSAETLISIKENHESRVINSTIIRFKSVVIDGDLSVFLNWLSDKEYEYNEKEIKQNIYIILTLDDNYKIVLAKIIEVYWRNECNSIDMPRVLDELICDEFQLSFVLDYLEKGGIIKEVTKYTMESIGEMEDGSFCDLSEDYIYRIYHGRWCFRKEYYIIVLIYEYINSLTHFLDFLINKNLSYITNSDK